MGEFYTLILKHPMNYSNEYFFRKVKYSLFLHIDGSNNNISMDVKAKTGFHWIQNIRKAKTGSSHFQVTLLIIEDYKKIKM